LTDYGLAGIVPLNFNDNAGTRRFMKRRRIGWILAVTDGA
jgi:hypothetical protein